MDPGTALESTIWLIEFAEVVTQKHPEGSYPTLDFGAMEWELLQVSGTKYVCHTFQTENSIKMLCKADRHVSTTFVRVFNDLGSASCLTLAEVYLPLNLNNGRIKRTKE